MQVKLAVVQPLSYAGAEEPKNVEKALEYIDQAAGQGANIVVLPEGYPGPANPDRHFDALGPLCAKAKEKSVYVVASWIEPAAAGHYMVLKLLGPDGSVRGTYRRTTPDAPYIYKDIDAWQFDYAQGEELPVFETEYGRIGLLVCSEIYSPELSRVLALKGAEIIVAPAGALINELMPTWKTMVWARAIENLCFTAACQNIYGVEDGVAMICGPEEVLAETRREGVIVATLNMDRMRWLRQESEKIEMPKKYRVVPGTLRWRRPALYARALGDQW